MKENFEVAKKTFKAARDMNKYFMQQVWLQNYPRILDFFVEKFDNISDDLLKVIWEQPKAIKSES